MSVHVKIVQERIASDALVKIASEENDFDDVVSKPKTNSSVNSHLNEIRIYMLSCLVLLTEK